MIRKERLPFVLFAMLCLLAGLWSGLIRIGWNLPVLPAAAHHGAIMVGGFLGTLISLEKIIPLKKKALYLIPISSALSVVLFFSKPEASICMLIASSAALVFVFLYYLSRQRSIIYVLMLLGAICWLTGNILLLTKLFYPMAYPWWVAFALFIIAGERLELMNFRPVTKFQKYIFFCFLLSYAVGILFSFHGIGNRVCGLALMCVAVWLMRNDLIAFNLKKENLPKFVAVALLCGYIALLLTGTFYFTLADQLLSYDAIVHSFFLGFVFSMIFAHGPIILPGVLGISVSPFSKVLYVWLALLQVSWVVRIWSDMATELHIRKLSGLLSAIAIIGYFITMIILMARSQQHAKVR